MASTARLHPFSALAQSETWQEAVSSDSGPFASPARATTVGIRWQMRRPRAKMPHPSAQRPASSIQRPASSAVGGDAIEATAAVGQTQAGGAESQAVRLWRRQATRALHHVPSDDDGQLAPL